MALNTYDEVNIARIFNEVLDERERKRHPYVDLNHLIMEVRSTADPNFREAVLRENFRLILEPLAELAQGILDDVKRVDISAQNSDTDALMERAYTCMVRLRRHAKEARERGVDSVADDAERLSEAIKLAVTAGEKD